MSWRTCCLDVCIGRMAAGTFTPSHLLYKFFLSKWQETIWAVGEKETGAFLFSEKYWLAVHFTLTGYREMVR